MMIQYSSSEYLSESSSTFITNYPFLCNGVRTLRVKKEERKERREVCLETAVDVEKLV